MFGYERSDCESWQAVNGTRDDAIAAAIDEHCSEHGPGEEFTVRTCECDVISDHKLVPAGFGAVLLDAVADERAEYGYEDDWPDYTFPQEQDLRRRIGLVFEEWVKRHGFSRLHWTPKEDSIEEHRARMDDIGASAYRVDEQKAFVYAERSENSE